MANQGGRYEVRNGKKELVECTDMKPAKKEIQKSTKEVTENAVSQKVSAGED